MIVNKPSLGAKYTRPAGFWVWFGGKCASPTREKSVVTMWKMQDERGEALTAARHAANRNELTTSH